MEFIINNFNVFTFSGLLFIGIFIPLIFNKIPPNRFYGLRTRKTLGNKDVWYKANKYMGRDLCIAGVVITVGSYLVPLLQSKSPTSMLLLIPVGIALIRSLIYLRKL